MDGPLFICAKHHCAKCFLLLAWRFASLRPWRPDRIGRTGSVTRSYSILTSSGNRCRILTRASESTVFSASRPRNSDSVFAKLTSQLNHIINKPVFIGTPFWNMPLCGTMLPQNPASLTLRDFELATHMINASTTTNGAQKFPIAASFKINLSSVRSDTALLSCSFSFRSRFSSFS